MRTVKAQTVSFRILHTLHFLKNNLVNNTYNLIIDTVNIFKVLKNVPNLTL